MLTPASRARARDKYQAFPPPVRPGTQFVAIYPEPTPFDPADLGKARKRE